MVINEGLQETGTQLDNDMQQKMHIAHQPTQQNELSIMAWEHLPHLSRTTSSKGCI